MFFKLMLVTNQYNTLQYKNNVNHYLHLITQCAHAGITSVQLREKNLDYANLFNLGKALQNILSPLGIPLIINDNVDLALALDADGVHLGQTDGCVLDARQRLGKDKIIGLSIDNLDYMKKQIETANSLPIDYIGVGAIFPTQTKQDIKHIWGVKNLKKAAALSKHPIVAIGGIQLSNTREIMQSGAKGVAAISIFHDNTAAETTKNLREIIEDFYHD